MSGWGTGWRIGPNTVEVETSIDLKEWPNPNAETIEALKEADAKWGVDPAKPGSDKTVYGAWTAEGWKELTEEEYLNKFKNTAPTHDPYTNLNSHIYYECGCGAILDPGTKSFAALNNCASEKGWKVRWGAESYQPYCVKCGEGVE